MSKTTSGAVTPETYSITDKPERYCAICGRRIYHKTSVALHIGPKCIKKLQKDAERRQAFLFTDSEDWNDARDKR